MSVKAYITAGEAIIPVLLPTDAMRDTARQLDMKESDLFCVDVPAGLSRHTRARVLIPSTKIADLFSTATVTLTLEDSGGLTITLNTMYARPPQPFFWREPGGVAMVDLVDERWFWQFSSAVTLDERELRLLGPLFSSDGRVKTQIRASYADIVTEITAAASDFNLTMPTTESLTESDTRLVSDLVATPNMALSLLFDQLCVASGLVTISTGSGAPRMYPLSGLSVDYDTKMDTYQRAMRGGMQPLLDDSSIGDDPLVTDWNVDGYQTRCPAKGQVIYPKRLPEAITIYNNCSVPNVPTGQYHFNTTCNYVVGVTPLFGRSPAHDIGRAILPSSAVVVGDCINAIRTSAPGWPVSLLSQIPRDRYALRQNFVPFGRTVWAGWVPWYASGTTIGQIGNVSYRLAVIDGHWSPYTITECSEDDWVFGQSGKAKTDPNEIITAKGKGQVYQTSMGVNIVDVIPPNTRVFAAEILGSTPCETNAWKWEYTFIETEPNSRGGWGCVSTQEPACNRGPGLIAMNLCEENNIVGELINPGVRQSDYLNATISALPIAPGTIVMMVEQFGTREGSTDDLAPRCWFSMPNAVKVECIPEPPPT